MADKFAMKTDLLAPESSKGLDLRVNNPAVLVRSLPDIVKSTMQIDSSNFFDDEFKWDKSGDPVNFFISVRGKKILDAYSSLVISIRVQGSQNMKDKEGSANITLGGSIFSEFPYASPLNKMMTWMNINYFYADMKRRYVELGKRMIEKVEAEIRNLFSVRTQEM